MALKLALVHHANQYLISERYENRQGLGAILGSVGARSGLTWILQLHRDYRIPANIHFSGTLLEAIAWHHPRFFETLREMHAQGLLEFAGSCYGQNIMHFFSDQHNLAQLNEELLLYRIHLGVDPESVKVFWPPERVWDTDAMAALLRSPRLLNGGYRYVLVDDRILLATDGASSPRRRYDRNPGFEPDLFRMYEIERGRGLLALPIAHGLRYSIPPHSAQDWRRLHEQLGCLSAHRDNADAIAIYADDMEKPAGIGGWGTDGPAHYEALLQWVDGNRHWLEPVKLSEWAGGAVPCARREVEIGTFRELANDFGAGEGYERWFFSPSWAPYRGHSLWAERRVRELEAAGADEALIALADKHLLASAWETAWHTPPCGPFGDPVANGNPSPWIRALASHSRHAAVISEAAHWMAHKNGGVNVCLRDLDEDGTDELVIRNDRLIAVFSPRWGGRLVALFGIGGAHGVMLSGNPSDDWNWMEELHRYMAVPSNHPGALADVGFEDDRYECRVLAPTGYGACARVEMSNIEQRSAARGLVKTLTLLEGEDRLSVEYRIPGSLRSLEVEFAFSPDYMSLLRNGKGILTRLRASRVRGCAASGSAVFVSAGERCRWKRPRDADDAHRCVFRLQTRSKCFSLSIGTVVRNASGVRELTTAVESPSAGERRKRT